MRKFFEKENIKLNALQEERFEKYYRILLEYNEKFNITAITDREEVIKKHFIDSALGVDKLVGNKLIDVGSGGGFPAIPLKIMKEDLSVTLVESTGKKCEFLKAVVKELNLTDVFVVNARAEEIAKEKEYRENFSICTARAVARLNTLLEYTLPLVKKGGIFIAYKGDADEEIIEAKTALTVLGGEILDVCKYELDGAKRALITVKKVKNTPSEYPRGNGKERKKPL